MQQLCTGGGQIETLVLVDRTVDPLTPLCTQLTYEGLVDETLHIKNGVVQLGGEGENAASSASAAYLHGNDIVKHPFLSRYSLHADKQVPIDTCVCILWLTSQQLLACSS